MPATHVNPRVTLDEAQAALTRELGPGYTVTRRSSGSPGLTVRRNGLLRTSVTASQANGGTTFKVHGGGVIINRLVAELWLARKVTGALDRAFTDRASG